MSGIRTHTDCIDSCKPNYHTITENVRQFQNVLCQGSSLTAHSISNVQWYISVFINNTFSGDLEIN
jgi:hypothetical protein